MSSLPQQQPQSGQLQAIRQHLIQEATQAAANFFTITCAVNNSLGDVFPQFTNYTQLALSKLEMLKSQGLEIAAIKTFCEQGLMNHKKQVSQKDVQFFAVMLGDKLNLSPQELVSLASKVDPVKLDKIWNGIFHLFLNAEKYITNINVIAAMDEKSNGMMEHAQQIAQAAIQQSGGNKEVAQQMIMQHYMSKLEELKKQ